MQALVPTDLIDELRLMVFPVILGSGKTLSGEMDEIAATFEAAGLPGGFHTAAAEVYRRMAGFKDAPALPALPEVLAALLKEQT